MKFLICRLAFIAILLSAYPWLVLAQSVPEEAASDQPDTSDPSPLSDSTELPESSSVLTEGQDALPDQAEKIIKAVDIQGIKSISITAVLAKIKTRVGEPYRQNVISDDLKRLYNTGFFSDVSVDRQDYEGGVKVIIFLVEKPIIDQITFSKTRHIKQTAILSKIKTKKGKFLDNKTLKEDVDTIKELYAKKGLTTVEVEAEPTIDQQTNKAKLHFIIKEGGRVQIKKINVFGNKAYREKRIIRLIKTRADSLFTSGYLKTEILDEDMGRITSYYEREGYIDATVAYELEDIDQGRLIVNIRINEGRRYFVENVTVAGNTIFSEPEIKDVMKEVKSGTPFSREKLTVDISNIRTLYFDRGYIFAYVRESTSLNTETGKVEVRLDVEEGQEAYVNKVIIRGNTRTRDIVIRRELKLHPGDRFDGAKLRRSKERLKNLGYFEDIAYDVEDTDNLTEKDLVVEVKEAKTGTLSFGGGFSTVDKVVGFVEIEQKNFDFTNWPTFTGGGQNLTLHAETGSTRNNTRLSFTEPWLFDYPISGGFDLYRTERDRERDVGYGYDERRIGGDVRFGKQFTDFVSGDIFYRLEEITIDNFESDVSADLRAEEGENAVSTIGLSVTQDKTDSIINPTRGWVLGGGADVAGGVIGGDKDFYRIQSRTSYFVPLKYDSVLEFRLRGGVVNEYGDSDRVPIFERFFAGGARTIRGYDERKVGPIDPVTEDPIGGEAMLVGNIEYTVPLIEFLKMAAFYDVGNVWSKVDDIEAEFKSGFGFGLRVKTPIGPINLDYGFPLNDEPGEEERSGKFYFSVSRGF